MTLATVRALIPDNYEYDRATATGDGATKEFKLPNAPMLSGSAAVYVDGVEQAPANYTINYDLGLLTFVAAPINGAAIVATYQHSVLSDANINSFLTLEGNNDKRAAALGLETMASREAYVQKVIRLLDLSTNGAQTAAALMKRAEALRAQADAEDVEGAFDWAEQVVDDFSYRERIYKQGLREG